MSDKNEDKYMKENKKTMQQPPVEKEGLEEPRTVGYPAVKIGIVVFTIIVIIIIIIGISNGMYGLFDN